MTCCSVAKATQAEKTQAKKTEINNADLEMGIEQITGLVGLGWAWRG